MIEKNWKKSSPKKKRRNLIKMSDIEMNVDDHNLSKELNRTYSYEKTVVPFNSMQDLKDCLYLGGKSIDND